MKEIFDWLREQMEWNQIIEMHFDGTPPKQYVERERWVDVINEAEAKWKAKHKSYDVEKVVEELKDVSVGTGGVRIVTLSTAIEIVRKGGV